MRHEIKMLMALAGICLFLLTSVAAAQGQGIQKDVFKGKLFAPNIILEHQDELGLSKEQFTAIRAAVVEVQSNVAGHEWDLREAYQRVLSDLDDSPWDEPASVSILHRQRPMHIGMPSVVFRRQPLETVVISTFLFHGVLL